MSNLGYSIQNINQRIREYFKDFEIDDIDVRNGKKNTIPIYSKECDTLECPTHLFIRNDSLIAWVEFYPNAHYSHQLYSVPIGPIKDYSQFK